VAVIMQVGAKRFETFKLYFLLEKNSFDLSQQKRIKLYQLGKFLCEPTL